MDIDPETRPGISSESDAGHKNKNTILVSLPRKSPEFLLNSGSPADPAESAGEIAGRVTGSLTVEAALALPFFLVFCRVLLGLFLAIQMQAEAEFCLDERAEDMSLSAFFHMEETDGGFSDTDYEDVVAFDEYFPDAGLPLFDSVRLFSARRAWAGRFMPDGGTSPRYVIVTETGSVYHLTESCSYLSLSVKEVSFDEVSDMRSSDGAKYYPCERCARGMHGSTCYITGDGRRYHYRRDCSGLKRTWNWVEYENCGLPPCSRCAK